MLGMNGISGISGYDEWGNYFPDPSVDVGNSAAISYCTLNPAACGGVPQPVYSPVGKAVSSTNIFDAIMTGINASSKILSTRYGVPQLNPGQYIQTGPGGSVQYQLAPGQTLGFPGLSTFGSGALSGGMMLPLIGIGLIALMMVKK